MLQEMYKQISRSATETRQIGAAFAKALQPGDVMALFGDLGSGKTVFIQGVCESLGYPGPVTSPTYTLVQEYESPMLNPVTLFHFDFYRLDSASDFISLDLDGYFERNGISLVEWAEKGLDFLPEDRFEIHLNRIYKQGKIMEDQREVQILGPKDREIIL